MTENLDKKPVKGILKRSTANEQAESIKNVADIKWDEMNILQTLHPPDKDYGHMKIDEPKTPYSYYEVDTGKEVSGHGSDTLNAEALAQKINSEKDVKPKVLDSPSEEENEEEETEEEKAQKSAFEYKRKMHYNEFYAVKLARKLIDDDDPEAEEEDGN